MVIITCLSIYTSRHLTEGFALLIELTLAISWLRRMRTTFLLNNAFLGRCNSTIQTRLHTVAFWSSSNWMKLNAKKCKEMRICCLKDPIDFHHLKIDDQQLEIATSHKVLCLALQSNLKWNNHIESIVTKASKSLHLLRVLCRGGIESNDLINIYTALIQSLLLVGQAGVVNINHN